MPGKIMVRGLGILFVMWNVPYAAALLHPVRYVVPFACAVVAQFIGLAGEAWMFVTLPPGHAALRATGSRFIVFDAAGFALLIVAFALVMRFRRIVG